MNTTTVKSNDLFEVLVHLSVVVTLVSTILFS